jgi:single-strand DNA-binding protein
MTEIITVHGGLTAPPELRYSAAGVPIVSGTVASTERYKDRQSGEWKDGKSLYLRFSAFKELAENIAASNLEKGAQVFVTGKLHTRQFEDRDGQKRTSVELDVVDFGVSLRRATAQVTRTASTASPQGEWQAPAQDEPWGGSRGEDTPF